MPESKRNPLGASAVTHCIHSQPTLAFRSPPQARSDSDIRGFRGGLTNSQSLVPTVTAGSWL